MYQRNKIANIISKLNFYNLIPYPKDTQNPPNRPRYQLTRGLIGLDNKKDAMTSLSSQEGSTMCHLASARYLAGLASGKTGRLFLSFGRLVCTDQITMSIGEGINLSDFVFISMANLILVRTDSFWTMLNQG